MFLQSWLFGFTFCPHAFAPPSASSNKETSMLPKIDGSLAIPFPHPFFFWKPFPSMGHVNNIMWVCRPSYSISIGLSLGYIQCIDWSLEATSNETFSTSLWFLTWVQKNLCCVSQFQMMSFEWLVSLKCAQMVSGKGLGHFWSIYERHKLLTIQACVI